MQNVDDSSLVINIRNQPASIVADVKDYGGSDAIRIVQGLPDVEEIVPFCSLYDAIPDRQRCVPFSVLLASLPDFPAAYDTHSKSSHIAKK
jgi:hypothetical protein